jgi:hypothetical protein
MQAVHNIWVRCIYNILCGKRLAAYTISPRHWKKFGFFLRYSRWYLCFICRPIDVSAVNYDTVLLLSLCLLHSGFRWDLALSETKEWFPLHPAPKLDLKCPPPHGHFLHTWNNGQTQYILQRGVSRSFLWSQSGANWLTTKVCHYLQDSHIQPACCVINLAMIDWLADYLTYLFNHLKIVCKK